MTQYEGRKDPEAALLVASPQYELMIVSPSQDASESTRRVISMLTAKILESRSGQTELQRANRGQY